MAQAQSSKKSEELMNTALSSVPKDVADVIKDDPTAKQFYGVSKQMKYFKF